MLAFSEASLGEIAVHKVGNKSKDENLVCSKTLLQLEDNHLRDLLKKYFLSAFKEDVFYTFAHETNIELNEVYHYVQQFFADPDTFHINTVNLAKLLYEKSEHPKVKSGEFYVVYFRDCVVDEELCDAIGLFKSENKDTYIKVFDKSGGFGLETDKGININKLDKGCLIFNTEADKGYKICMVDNTNKGLGNEAQYWKDTFLKIKPREDNFYHTANFLNLCKNFCDEYLETVQETTRQDQLIVKNNTMEYFSEKEVFNVQEFENTALQEPIVIEAFQDYKQAYFKSNEIVGFDEFDISDKAVKKAKKVFKSILKLDKNFHIYIHGRHDLIERGMDEEKGMNFYKVYFLQEE